ncbi:macrophage mannose receptor 1-like [Schistocerca gregaria]|uniref:macrophage mannose receptor 1-like n=1 Tax=Schistocerca gregaria TaxID=7010 RepID=UPI00211E629C|nr:macrophage mannose receptor 1-like [Schistocerca gregaria]
MFVVSVSPVGSMIELLLMVLLIGLHTVSGQSSLIQCHCNINRLRGSAMDVVCSKSKNLAGKLQCSKASVQDVPAGYEYVEPWGLFKLYRPHMARDAAFATCQRHGGRLAIPRDKAAASALGNMVRREPGIDAAFVGIHDIMTEGIFYGDDGQIATYQEWRYGEPGHGSDDDTCVVMTDDGRLDGLQCEAPAPFLCERPQASPLPAGYRYVGGASAFLKLYTQNKVAYSSAQKVCEADGGALAVPDTWRRAEAMIRLIPAAAGHVYVGLTDLQSEGSFITNDNTRYLSDMEFDAWEAGQPDNGDGYGYEDCLALHPNGTLFDVACHLPLAFLCELPPP